MASFQAFEQKLLKIEGLEYTPNDIKQGYGSKFGVWRDSYLEATKKTVSESFIQNGTWDTLKVVPQYFWKKFGCDRYDSQLVADIIFWSGYNSGTTRLGCILQNFINEKYTKLTIDGIVGSQTIAAVNAAVKKNEIAFYDAWREYMIQYYSSSGAFCKGCASHKNCKAYTEGCQRDTCQSKNLMNFERYFLPINKTGADAINHVDDVMQGGTLPVQEVLAERAKVVAQSPKSWQDWLIIFLVLGVVGVLGGMLWKWIKNSRTSKGVKSASNVPNSNNIPIVKPV